LNNRLGITLSNGHNNLCRTSLLQGIGGFDERFISEDHATTLNLMDKGLACEVIDVESFEMMPVDLFAFKRRTRRWVRNDIQLLKHPWRGVSLAIQFRLMLHVILHFLWLPAVVILLYTLWSTSSSLGDIVAFSSYLIYQRGYQHPQVVSILIVFLVYLVYLYGAPIPQAITSRTGVRAYLHSAFVTFCLGFAAMFDVIYALASALAGVRFPFEVTPKKHSSDTLLSFVADNWILCILIFVTMAGIEQNPVIIMFNWTWIIPLLASPMVLYTAQLLKPSPLPE
jgi:cellulose synthase/poly-beta-1,6-N-acetylglucosamine synthase-like glycosyltransferase